MKSMARVRGLVVDRLHALLGQRAGVLDLLGAVRVGPGVDHAARPELLAELGVLRVVLVLRLFLGVQVVEVAEELVEAVVGRQVLVVVAEVVLAELAGGVALGLEQTGDGRVFRPHAELGARAGRPWTRPVRNTLWPVMKDDAAGGAALLAVVVGEDHALVGDAVDVGRPVAHQAHACRR